MTKNDFLKKISRMLNPKLVSIHDDAIEGLSVETSSPISFHQPAPAEAVERVDSIHFALAFNSINHQFWDVVDGRFERYEHRGRVGALAMREGLAVMLADAGSMRALGDKLPLSVADIEKYFGPIPDPEGRAKALSQALGPKGCAAAMLLDDSAASGEVWGIAHAQAIASLLPLGYEDVFLKKAQLCLWMSKGMLQSRGMEAPEVDLTCFADYQVPKVLRALGVISYEKKLAAKVDSGCVMEEGCSQERAIRAATVIACERIAKHHGVSAPQLDYELWLKRNDTPELFHRVRTRKY